MKCLDEAMVSAFVQGELSADDRALVEAHLEDCAPCREGVRDREAFPIDELRTQDSGRAPGHAPRFVRGSLIGRYVVISPLGRGGMGVVYAAYDPELDRKVAIKLLHRGEGRDEEARVRLLAEAQALARLAHPNVVAVYDVGTFGEQVFVTMEYVEGATLRAYTEHGRRWQEVVALFLQAGRGLAAAHRAGLVHRDFKPQNVLVSDDGRARVLDFGLARPTHGVSSDHLPEARPDRALGEQMTETGTIVGTPAYMSPEQAAGLPATAASDQFSFAVALHEALCGNRPFAGASVEELLAAMRLGKRAPPAREVAPPWVRQVIERALAIDPGARWPSMDALLDALARDPRARRRRLAAAGLVLLGLAIGGVGVARLAKRPEPCHGGAERLAGVWDDAQRARVKSAFAAAHTLVAAVSRERAVAIIDRYASAWVAARTDACEATRTRGEQSEEQMGLRMICLDERLADLRALVGLLETGDDATLARSIEAALALPPIDRCADLRLLSARLPPPADASTAREVARAREALARAGSLKALGKAREALELANGALAVGRRLDYCPLHAESLLLVGNLQGSLGLVKESVATLYDAVWKAESCRDDEIVARGWNLLIYGIGLDLGRPEDAERTAKHAAAAIARLGGDDLLESSRLSHLALVYMSEGRHDEAIEAGRRAVALAERARGPDDAKVAKLEVNLGLALKNRGRIDEALRVLERARTILERAYGPQHPTVAQVEGLYATTLRAAGRLAESVAHQRHALELLSAVDPSSVRTSQAAHHLATALVDEGRYAAAEALFRRSLAVTAAQLGAEHPDALRTTISLADCLRREGRAAEAEALVRDALAHIEKHGHAGVDLADAVTTLSRVELALGRAAQAESDARRALAIFEKVPEDPGLGDAAEALGNALAAQGKHSAALAAYQRSATLVERSRPAMAGVPLAGVGRAQLALGRTSAAVAALERAVRLEEKRGNAEALAGARFALAQALWASGDRIRAATLAEQARAGFAQAGDARRGQLAEVEAWMAARR